MKRAARAPSQIRTLVMDIGGTGLKASVLDRAGRMLVKRVRVATPYPCPPEVLLKTLAALVAPLPAFDRISAGFPGVALNGGGAQSSGDSTVNGFVSRLSIDLAATDVYPDAFSFAPALGVPLGSVQVSAPAAIGGIAGPVPISIVGGNVATYCISSSAACGSPCDVLPFTNAASTISSGQFVCVRQTAPNTTPAQVKATILAGSGQAAFIVATGTAPPPTLQEVASRKTHPGAGVFDLALGLVATNPTTEPRSAGAGNTHTIVFKFDQPVNGGTATVTEGSAIAATPTFAGSEMTIALSGVANASYSTVTVANVTPTGGGSAFAGAVRIGFLAGDVSQNLGVTLSDLLSVNNVLTQTVTAANYLRDVSVSGTLSLADVLFVNARLTQALPPP